MAKSPSLDAAVTHGFYTSPMFFSYGPKSKMPDRADALPGRADPLPTAERHFVNGQPLNGPYPAGSEIVEFGMGCFWGAEKDFWQVPGVIVTAVGYQGGYTPNCTYKEICSGRTGHAETVRVVYDPTRASFELLLRTFWQNHDPTQGHRQGNDVGTQYRSAIYTHTDAQLAAAMASREMYAAELAKAGFGPITTEIAPAPEFFFAEDYHQQYLAKNPHGYNMTHGTGVACAVGTGVRLGEPVERMEPV